MEDREREREVTLQEKYEYFQYFCARNQQGGFCETVTNAKVIKWPPQMQAAIFDRIFAKKKTGNETDR